MLLIDIDRSINKLILTTDDPTIHFFMESKKTQYQYIPWKKHWGYVDRKVKIYDSGKKVKGEDLFRYELGLGWASYLIGIFKDKISAENYEYIIKNVILADNYRTIPFTELRDYQNDDVLFLLKYRLGLMQVNTGYGLELPHYVDYIIVKHRVIKMNVENTDIEINSLITKGKEIL